MTQSRQSAQKVGVWRTPDETTIERIMLQGLQIQLRITCKCWVKEKHTVISTKNLASNMTYYIQV